MAERHIVTKSSKDGTFQVGDHIILYENGDIGCVEAQGWIPADEVPDATAGMEYAADTEYVERKKRQLREALAALEA